MINTSTNISNMISSPSREIKARVELYKGSTLLQIFKYNDALKSVTVDRVGQKGKFFGFGVSQKLTFNLIDKDRTIEISDKNTVELEFGADSEYVYTFPYFKVKDIKRDENTNELTITAYDAIYDATAHTVSELNLPTSYTIEDVARACAKLLKLPFNIENVTDDCFSLYFDSGANFEGTETIREALDAIAEATQTIYYINSQWQLTFKRLDKDGAPVLVIDKSKYFTLESKTNRRLTTICHATELGDNVSASYGDMIGTTHYVRNNPFWELREDIADLVENAVENIGGLSINQFNCSWRGNFLLEIGDKIAIETKDNSSMTSYVLDDSVSYSGGFSAVTSWEYEESEGETASNPSTLGESLKKTYAKVDKVNKTVEIVAKEAEANSENISQILLDTSSISARVTATAENAEKDIKELTEKVEATVSAQDVKIVVQEELNNGVEKVVTSTGFTFDDKGLTIEKSGSELATNINEDGLKVFKNNEEVLTADNKGVKAIDLHAKTYLIIGTNSRIEDFESDRTGCFWIG